MPHPKKKHPHYCHNHPRVIAAGRCASCRSWICRECAKPETMALTCLAQCTSAAHAADKSGSGEAPGAAKTQPASIHGLMLLAAITLGLCGVVFGLWEIRQYRMLSADMEGLKEKRIGLIDHIKDANREIASLRSELDSLKLAGFHPVTAGRKKAAFPQDAAAAAGAIGGVPFSFDNGSVEKKALALTFDGGSQCNAAADILDTLKSRNIRATIFITGEFIRAFPETVKRIAAEGHETGNHTFSHPHLTTWAQDHTHTTNPVVTESIVCQELARTDSVYFVLTGSHLNRFWRAPYGEKNHAICAWAQRCGYLHIGWRQGKSWRQGLDSNDWIPDEETPGFHTPEEVLEKIIDLALAQPSGINGGIILMHLGTVRKDPNAQVHRILGKLIDELQGLGYHFVTVSEMLKDSGIGVSLPGENSLTRN
jgi:peptidoglycan/xylan/chitin deacetylase (PgdA/CDA1 family)